MGAINLTKQTVNLSKQQTINLSKDYDAGLDEIQVGLGWDPAKPKPMGGILGSIFGLTTKVPDIDCDAWVSIFDDNDKVLDTIYFNNLKYMYDGRVVIEHHGDNLTGVGAGDDEVITIHLHQLPANAKRLTIGVTIYRGFSRGQSFDIIENVYIRLVDVKNNFEICRYADKNIYEYPRSQTFYAGDLINTSDGWQFRAIGVGDMSGSIGDAVKVAANANFSRVSGFGLK